MASTLLVGCATSGQLGEVRDLAQRALDEARAAQSKANMADNHAKAAMQSADKAGTCCAANTERIERAMERSMSK